MADIRGTTGSNTLNAADGVTNSADEIYGRGGNDIVFGLDGGDLIADGAWSSGPAREPFNIILHNFATWSSGGNDEFHGGEGNDRLIGDGGDDQLFGEGDNDTLIGGQGNDTLDGGSGSDILIDDDGNEVIIGGTGTDTVRFRLGGSGDQEPSGDEPLFPVGVKGVFADFEAGRSGFAFDDPDDNRIFNVTYSSIEVYETDSSRSQRDEIRGDNTGDTFRTFGGNDIIEGKAGADTIDGGAGSDTASYESSNEGVSVSLNIGSNAQLDDATDVFGDVLISIENLTGSSFSDFLRGNSSANILKGLNGNDTLNGLGGADRMEGGNGTDTAEYGGIFGSQSGVTISTDGTAGSGGDAQGDRLIGVENISGSNFDDTLSGDDATNNKLFGNGGDDDLSGRGGDDTLEGGSGFNVLDGGTGTDTASYRNATGDVSLSLLDLGSGGSASGPGFSDTLFSIENADGSEFDDDFLGNGDANRLRGFGGNDGLHGFGGNDRLEGGEGDDLLNGGLGADQLFGSTGTDTATYALAGSAVVADLQTGGSVGEAAGDTYSSIENLIGSSSTDILRGNSIANVLSGGADNDVLIGRGGGDTLNGGSGIDTASYETSTAPVLVDLLNLALNTGDAAGDTYSSIEIIACTDFGDTLRGNDAGNEFFGRGGNDTLEGRGGNDTLRGGDNDDTLIGGAGADALFGGDGLDTAEYQGSASGVTVSTDGSVGAGGDGQGDTLNGVENIIGSAFDDTLSGDDATNNRLFGLGGDDDLSGRGGNDRLEGGEDDDLLDGGLGGDRLEGGNGSDTASYRNAAAGLVADLVLGGLTGEAIGDTYDSIENLEGSAQGDLLRGDAQANILSGGEGDDTLVGREGGDTLRGGIGTDSASYDTAAARVVVDLANLALNQGDAAGDTYDSIEIVFGTAFKDVLSGDGADNTFFGNADTDKLEGRDGNDTLRGGDANDNLLGGAGADALFGGDGDGDNANYQQAGANIVVALDGTLVATSDAIGDTFDGIESLTGATVFKNRLRGDGGDNVLVGGANQDTLEGQGGADTLRGNGDNDILLGSLGNDVLLGGAGADTFKYNALIEGGDRIDDFAVGIDELEFRAVSLGAGFAPGQALNANQLVLGAAADQAFGQFIYDTSSGNGELFFDADGTGAGTATFIARLTGGPALGVGDFDII